MLVFANCLNVFTGLVQDIGKVLARSNDSHGARLRISTKLGTLELGESIAVMGVCLTVHRLESGSFQAEASIETLQRTTLGQLSNGSLVHLERAVRLSDRLGGHLVAGHVDEVARLLSKKPLGDAIEMTFSYGSELAPFIAEKGSIAVNGVSLTINDVDCQHFRVVMVPHTLQQTLFAKLHPGSAVNLEVDVLARYVVRYLQVQRSEQTAPVGKSRAVTEESMTEQALANPSLLARLVSSGFV